MSYDTAIRLDSVAKRYRIGVQSDGGHYRYKSLRDSLVNTVTRPWQVIANHRRLTDDNSFWALDDVSFEVKQGQAIGIIGRNGAGKSTLLKILSRITKPTRGEIKLYGRVGSLLEVGTGFHPELSGRENIFLNGSVLGMTRAEVQSKFDEIVEFSEVERFLDTPVKQYSSGMYTRLAFAVAAHLDPEILIIDEVLAVGDANFQKKCLGKMKDVAKQGRTILFVSHNMAAIENLCDQVVVLSAGRSGQPQSPSQAIATYLGDFTPHAGGDLSDASREVVPRSGSVFRSISMRGDDGSEHATRTCGRLTIDVELSVPPHLRNITLGVVMTTMSAQRVVAFQSEYNSALVLDADEHMRVRLEIPRLALVPDDYAVELVAASDREVIERIPVAAHVEVIAADVFRTGMLPSTRHGYAVLEGHWSDVSRVPSACHR